MSARDYPDRPWIGIGVVVWRGDAVLLVRRAHPPLKGQWSIPGGMQEIGETARQAGVREVFEETGLEIRIDGLIDVIDVILPDDAGQVRTHYTLIDFYGHCLEGAGQEYGTNPRAGDDADEALWVSVSALDEYGLWPETLRVIEVSRQIRNGGVTSAS